MSIMIDHTEPLTHAEAEHLDCTYCGREACPDECNDLELIESCPSTAAGSCFDCHRDRCRSPECGDAWEE